jgi:diguanylate cyclase (GGDEF)-like protein
MDSSGSEPNVSADATGTNGPARRLLGGLRMRLERGTSTASLSQERDEALLILKTHEESGQGWFWATDLDGNLTYLTDSVSKVLRKKPGSLLGTPFADLFATSTDPDRSHRTLPFVLARKMKFSKLALEAAGSLEVCWWEISGSPQFDKQGEFTGYRGSGIDVTEQRRSSQQVSQLAMYDALTGLPNRRHMGEMLDTTLANFERTGRHCSVMLIDLDRFKQVNDTLGHPAGDALLKQVAERLLKIIGDKEKLCRLGGDEFQIILPDRDDRGMIGALANEIINSLSQPYSVEGSRCIIGASIGIAISPFDGVASDEVIRNADLALYAAKGSGRGRFRFFSGELLRAAEDKRVLEEDLRDAVAKGEMELFYQPIVCATSNCVKGVEALIRWNHPQRGPISPALFIPIAEETTLIEEIGEWTLRRACEDAALWPQELRVAVNLSPVQFANESFPDLVRTLLSSSGLPPARLELEITEGVFLSESDETDQMFETLKDIGVRLALDDFGTGYSSLGYLRSAPFDKIKIDQSFVRGATEKGSRNGAIIAAIVALAEALSMDTTAEGIESLDQLALVRKLNVSHIQGYIYSKAVSNAELCERLTAGDWVIEPSGPARQRNDRQSVFRQAGAIHGDHYYPVVIRNISTTGALMEGLVDVPVGTQFVVDFGEGQIVVATVRRSQKHQQGVEFEQLLVSDGNGGLCTRHRVSQYVLATAGLPGVNDTIAPKGAIPVNGVVTTTPVFNTLKNRRVGPSRKKAA